MDPSLPEGWIELCSKAGETFFFHFETGTSQPERPTKSGLIQDPAAAASSCAASGLTAEASYRTSVSRRPGEDSRGHGQGKNIESPHDGGRYKKNNHSRFPSDSTELLTPEPTTEASEPDVWFRSTERHVERSPPTPPSTSPPGRTARDIWKESDWGAISRGVPTPAVSPILGHLGRDLWCGRDNRNGGGRGGGTTSDNAGKAGGGGLSSGDAGGGAKGRGGGASVRSLAAMLDTTLQPPRNGGGRSNSPAPAGRRGRHEPRSSTPRSEGGGSRFATSSPDSLRSASPSLSSSPPSRPPPPPNASPARSLPPPQRTPPPPYASRLPSSQPSPSSPTEKRTVARGVSRLDLLKARVSSAEISPGDGGARDGQRQGLVTPRQNETRGGVDEEEGNRKGETAKELSRSGSGSGNDSNGLDGPILTIGQRAVARGVSRLDLLKARVSSAENSPGDGGARDGQRRDLVTPRQNETRGGVDEEEGNRKGETVKELPRSGSEIKSASRSDSNGPDGPTPTLGQRTIARGVSRLDLLKARVSSAETFPGDGRTGDGQRRGLVTPSQSKTLRGGDEEDETRKGEASKEIPRGGREIENGSRSRSGSGSGSNDPCGLTLDLSHESARGGLLSKTGSLRMMAVAQAGAAGGTQQNPGAAKAATAETQSIKQRQHHREDNGDDGNRPAATADSAAAATALRPPAPGGRVTGNVPGDTSGDARDRHRGSAAGVAGGRSRDGGSARESDAQRPHTTVAARVAAFTAPGPKHRSEEHLRERNLGESTTAGRTVVTRGSGGAGEAEAVRIAPSRRLGSPDHRPGPSPASRSADSSPPSLPRPRRRFFDTPGRGNAAPGGRGGGGDGDGDGGGGDRGGGDSGARPGAQAKAAVDDPKREGARGRAFASPVEKQGIAVHAASNGDGDGDGDKDRARGRSLRPMGSLKEAMAAAAASKDERDRVRRAREERFRRASSASPVRRRDSDSSGDGEAADEGEGGGGGRGRRGGGVMGKMFSPTAGRRAQAGTAVETALSPNGSRPNTASTRSRSLPPGAGRGGGHQQPRPATSIPFPSSETSGAGSGRMADGSAVGDSDGAPGYRAFVESRFYKGKGPAQLLMRFNANAITELMCHTTAPPRHALLSSTQGHFVEASKEMFRQIQSYMGDASPSGGEESPAAAGDEAILRDILLCGRSNIHMASELYCQLVKQTHRCVDAEKEERGFVLLACTAFLFPPPTDAIANVVLGHLALHRSRHCPVGGLALYSHDHVSSSRRAWAPVLETDPLIVMSEQMRDCARNCFVPGTVFGVTLEETLRQEYYSVGVGAVTSPAPPEASASARVPVLVQMLVQTIECLGGVRTEGIFRRPGHSAAKAALKEAISAGDYSVLRRLRDEGKIDASEPLGGRDFEVDVYTVADTLKAWLRSMKEPLVPAGSYERAVAAGNLTGGSEARQEEAIRVLLALPPPNSATLDFLARFLSKVAGQEKTNRMNAKGLAVVLSPNLLRNPEGNPLVFKANANAETIFVKSLIEGSKQ